MFSGATLSASAPLEWCHVHARTGSLCTRSFGVFEVDLRAAELRKFGIKIKLQEQPFQLLALLLTHPGELVTRDELRQALWPEHTFVDRASRDRSIRIAQTSHDRELKLSVIAARFQTVSKNPVELNQAVTGLDVAVRLALGQMELNSRNQSSGRAHRATLRKRAGRRGFQLVARKAAAALQVAHDQASGQRPSRNKNRELSRSTRA